MQWSRSRQNPKIYMHFIKHEKLGFLLYFQFQTSFPEPLASSEVLQDFYK